MADQFYFGNDMQDLLLACMLRYGHQFGVLTNLVKPEYFWGMNALRVADAIQEYYAKQNHIPGFTACDSWLHEKFSRDKADLYAETHEYVEKLKTIPCKDWKWVKEVTVKFCRERAYIVAVKKAADLIKTDKVPEGGFTRMFDEAHNVGRDISDLGLSFTADMEDIVDQATAKNWGIRTGFQKLDEIWYNGWGPGWLVVPLAPPKSYKSTFCTNLALRMAKKGQNAEMCPIFYYACEISAELTALRGYCIVSGIDMDAMYKDPAQFKTAARKGLGKWFGTEDGFYGQILMKSYPAKTASISDIRSHALMAIEAFDVTPRVIVIDHAETIKVGKRAEDYSDHRAQADIYTEAKALGQELGAVVLMPDRCNKDTVQQPVPNMTSFQGSFEKAGIVDVSIGLCQTDVERAQNYIRYFIFLNRHSRQYDYFAGSIGEDRFSMTIDEKLDYVKACQEAEERAKERRKRGRNGRNQGGALFAVPELGERNY